MLDHRMHKRKQPASTASSPPAAALTLAQQLNLAPRPVRQQLSDADWLRVAEASQRRGDCQQPCPICCEPFGLDAQLLLSCSHTLHAACLSSLERFTQQRVCPCCRHRDYCSRVVVSPVEAKRTRAAIAIQRVWRGHRARCRVAAMPPRDLHKRSAFYVERLEATAAQREDELAELFASCDVTLAAARSTIREAERQHEQPSEHLWRRVRQRATSKAHSEQSRAAEACCICCEALHNGGRLVLLSCSHVLHRHCLRSYEQYTSGEIVAGGSGEVDRSGVEGGESKTDGGGAEGGDVEALFVPAGCVCPMCRSVYSKIAFRLPTT